MVLTSEKEKLRLAGAWLRERKIGSPDYEAAREHVTWVLTQTPDAGLRTEAQVIADKMLQREAGISERDE